VVKEARSPPYRPDFTKGLGIAMLSRIAAHFLGKRWIREIRSNRERIDELRSLLEEQKVVILKPFLGSKDAGAHAVSEEVVLDYVRSHCTIRIARDKVHLFPPGAVFLREPLALLSIPTSHNDYLNAVGRNPRKMIRRATKRGFSFREFAWNDHLDDIYAINTSKVRRCAGIMHGWYTQPVRPRFHPEKELPYRKYFGAFRDNRLRGYLHLLIAGDNAFFKHIIGHGDDLSCGIMNGLVFSTVQQFIGHPTVRWFKYYSLLRHHSGGLASFQRHIGFSGYATVLDLASHPDLLARVSAVESRWWAV
jgi:hypothetical protein